MYRVLAESVISDSFKRTQVKVASEEVVAGSCSKFLNGSFNTQQDVQQFIRSQSDKFDYRLVQLQNGIRILLISDPSYKDLGSNSSSQEDVSAVESSGSEHSDSECSDSDESMSSCSSISKKGNDKLAAFVIGVDIGAFDDPREFQGMAHMLEHMMSMGSEAFPSENEIDKFLSSRGGYANAHTECEYTCYEIQVHRRYLKQAIDLFGKAFVSPLLRQESIEKEIKPIDTEFIEASNDDDVRMQLLLSHLANVDHPINKFSWGNRKSLITDPTAKGLDIRKKLIEFFNKYYKPENIVVVVQSQESLSNLEEWTANVFAEVKARDLATKNEPFQKVIDCPFDNSKFNRFYIMESISSGTRLHLSWWLPSVLSQYLCAPFDYLTTLIGHEGKGSLLAELRKQDLAVELVTDSDYFCFKNNRLLSIFSVEIFLTDSGAEHLDQVVGLFFEYIEVIRKAGAQEYFFKENQTIALKSFNSKSERNPLSYSIELAKFMLNYPVEHLLTGYQLYYFFDKQAVDELLAKFLPETANYIHIGGKFKPDLTLLKEPWMETNYQEMNVPSKWIEQAKQSTGVYPSFHYPKPNPFIASKFDLVRDTLPTNAPEREVKTYPVKIYDTARMTVWHKSDFTFNLPKASIHVHILNPCVDDTLEDVALSDVLFEYLMILLKEDSYDAHVAGLYWQLQRTYNGIHVQAAGFNHKIVDLVLLLLQRFQTIQFDATFTESVKKEVAKFYNNDYQDAEDFNRHLRLSVLMERFYTFIDRWSQIKSIDTDKLSKYKQKFLSNLSFEILVQGNMTISETLDLTDRIKLIFDLDNSQSGRPYSKTKSRVVQLPTGISKIRALTLTEKNRISHVVCYYQLDPYTFLSHCYLSLFIEIVSELCFNTLRTAEGLGYSVGCVENDTFGILGFNVYVSSQADKFDCTHIEGRIEQFVDKTCYAYIMETLSQSKFDEFVSSAIKRKEAPDVKLDSEVSRHVDEINSFDYCFERLKREIETLKQANLNQLRQWTAQHIFLPNNQRRRLTIQIVGNGSQALDECVTLEKTSVKSSLIPNDGQPKPLQLLRSKDLSQQGFIDSVDEFKKQLQLYPTQKALKDL